MHSRRRSKCFILFILIDCMLVSIGYLYGYQWPLEPFNTQGKVTDVLDACRGDRHHFHDGIDIGVSLGTSVYAVVDGTAHQGGTGDNTYIRLDGAMQTFWYIHLKDRVDDGKQVSTGDFLGKTKLNHLHFGEGPDKNEINPLRSDGISPFTDTENPTIEWIKFYENGTTTEITGDILSGKLVDIVVKVKDKITSGGTGAGIYRIGYELKNAGGTGFDVQYSDAFKFDNWIESTYIKNVYFSGSNTGTYIYIVTNTVYSDGYWDTGWYSGAWKIIVTAYDIDQGGKSKEVKVNVVGVEEERKEKVTSFSIKVTPNPFTTFALINYSIKNPSFATLRIYDVSGCPIREIVYRKHLPGKYTVYWDGLNDAGKKVSNGVYFIKFSTKSFWETKKVILLK